MFERGDLVEVIKNEYPFHDFIIGNEYFLMEILTNTENEYKYILTDFNFTEGYWFTQAVSSKEIKLIRKDK